MTWRFLRCERASAAIEGAFAMFVLVGAFGSLMGFVSTIYTDDQMGRGARTVARALALDPGADPWAAFKREVDLDLASCSLRSDGVSEADTLTFNKCDAGCKVCDGWTMKISRRVKPKDLDAALGGNAAAGDGEMILVRVEKGQQKHPPFGLARREPEE